MPFPLLLRRQPRPTPAEADRMRLAAMSPTPYPPHTTLTCRPCDVRWASEGGTACFVCGEEGTRAA